MQSCHAPAGLPLKPSAEMALNVHNASAVQLQEGALLYAPAQRHESLIRIEAV